MLVAAVTAAAPSSPAIKKLEKKIECNVDVSWGTGSTLRLVVDIAGWLAMASDTDLAVCN